MLAPKSKASKAGTAGRNSGEKARSKTSPGFAKKKAAKNARAISAYWNAFLACLKAKSRLLEKDFTTKGNKTPASAIPKTCGILAMVEAAM